MQWKQKGTPKFLRIAHKNLREVGVTNLCIWRSMVLVASSYLLTFGWLSRETDELSGSLLHFQKKSKVMRAMQIKHQYSFLCLQITLLVPEIWKGHYHGCSICKVYPKLSFQTWLGHRRKNLDEYQLLLSLNRWIFVWFFSTQI